MVCAQSKNVSGNIFLEGFFECVVTKLVKNHKVLCKRTWNNIGHTGGSKNTYTNKFFDELGMDLGFHQQTYRIDRG